MKSLGHLFQPLAKAENWSTGSCELSLLRQLAVCLRIVKGVPVLAWGAEFSQQHSLFSSLCKAVAFSDLGSCLACSPTEVKHSSHWSSIAAHVKPQAAAECSGAAALVEQALDRRGKAEVWSTERPTCQYSGLLSTLLHLRHTPDRRQRSFVPACHVCSHHVRRRRHKVLLDCLLSAICVLCQGTSNMVHINPAIRL